jgi:hypothetical protein
MKFYLMIALCAFVSGCATKPVDDWKPPAAVDPKTEVNLSSDYFVQCDPLPDLKSTTDQGTPLCQQASAICEEAVVSWVKQVTVVHKNCKNRVDSHIKLLNNLVSTQKGFKKND